MVAIPESRPTTLTAFCPLMSRAVQLRTIPRRSPAWVTTT